MHVMRFTGAVIDEDTLLNGVHEYTIEAAEDSADPDTAHTLLLIVRLPKGLDQPIEEADLTLTTPTGELLAVLTSGDAALAIDEDTDAEHLHMELRFEVESVTGESWLTTGGALRLTGVLEGAEARLEVMVAEESRPSPPGPLSQ